MNKHKLNWNNAGDKFINGIIQAEPNLSTRREVFDFLVEHSKDKEYFVKILGESSLPNFRLTMNEAFKRLKELR